MDSQVNLILDAVKRGIGSVRERQMAIVRAGLLAQAYTNYDDEMLEEVFGLGADSMLKNDVDIHTAVGAIGRR